LVLLVTGWRTAKLITAPASNPPGDPPKVIVLATSASAKVLLGGDDVTDGWAHTAQLFV
jgi:hypothetical protein